MKKRIYLLAIALVLAMSSMSLNAQNRIFGSLSKMEGVTSVYVGKPMLQLAGSNIDSFAGAGNINVGKLMSKLSGIEVVTCDKEKYAKKVNQAIESAIKSMRNLEVMTEVNSNESSKKSEQVVIYYQSNPDTDVITALIIAVISPKEPALIALHGKFTAEDLAELANSGEGASE